MQFLIMFTLYSFIGQLCFEGGSQTQPVELVGLGSDIISFAAGSESSYFVLDTGSAVSCGRNNFGQLGDGSTNDSFLTNVSRTNMGNSRIFRVMAGPSASSAMFETINLFYGTGLNSRGQLGVGDTNNRNIPVEVQNSQSMSSYGGVSVSDTHTLFW